MNLRFVTGLFAAVALMPMATLTSSNARADVPAVPSDVPITAAAKTSLNQSTYADEITQKVSAEVQKMAENASDAGTVKMTREWLVAESTGASAPYQQNYAAALNAAFMNVLGQGDPPVNFRINAGIVIYKLSGPKESLAQTVIKLLQDKCAAVVLWGNRAAGSMFPLAMQNANGAFNAASGMGSKVIDAVVASLSAHLDGPMSGDIADAAFKAVNPRLWDQLKNFTPPPPAMAMLVDANLKMQRARIEFYHTGVPEYPLADTYASYLVFSSNVWSGMAPADQLRAAQNAVDLVSLMGQRFVNKGANPNQDLMGAMNELGRWIMELGARLNNPGVQAAGNQVKTLNATLPAKTITDACDGVFAALQNDPAMGQLQAPLNLSEPASPAAKSGTDASTGSTPTSLAPQ